MRNERYLTPRCSQKYEDTNETLVSGSLDALSSISRPMVNLRAKLVPKSFIYNGFSDYSTSIPKELSLPLKYVSTDDGYAKIRSKYNPKTLEKNNSHIETDHISNFIKPSGSIAISSDLNHSMSTSELFQCAGVAIVDRTQNLQTLLHFCPYVSKKTNTKLLRYILSVSNPKNLDITIVPGCYNTTDLTVDFLVSRINKFAEGAKIKFANFPDVKNTTLILSKGKLQCSDGKNITKRTNPAERLIYATSV